MSQLFAPTPSDSAVATRVLRIGFVDHDLENFHANVYAKLLQGELAERGVQLAGCTAQCEEGGRAWAAQKGVPYLASPAQLAEEVDAFVVLAPSNPETHLELCEQVFPFGKPTFVDKTFAPDVATAEQIFALGDRWNTPVQTTSALRYTGVQSAMPPGAVRHVVAWGGGRSFDEYAIHPVEMAVSCLGPEATRLARRGTAKQSQLLIDFSGGRTAVVNVFTDAKTPYAATLSSDEETRHVAVDTSRLFRDAATAMLDFLEAGRPLIDRRETLTVMRILETAKRLQPDGRFVELGN